MLAKRERQCAKSTVKVYCELTLQDRLYIGPSVKPWWPCPKRNHKLACLPDTLSQAYIRNRGPKITPMVHSLLESFNGKIFLAKATQQTVVLNLFASISGYLCACEYEHLAALALDKPFVYVHQAMINSIFDVCFKVFAVITSHRK